MAAVEINVTPLSENHGRARSMSSARKSISRGASFAAKGASKTASRAVSVPAQPVMFAWASVAKYWNNSMARLKKSDSKTKLDSEPASPAVGGQTRVASATPIVDSPESPLPAEATEPTPAPAFEPAKAVEEAVEAVNEAVSEWATGLVQWATEKGLLEPEATPEPPKVVQLAIVKHGVPWRGSYERTLLVGDGKVVTIDPETQQETNSWESPRDVPKAVTNTADDTIELFVAPWAEAPTWLHQKFRFSVNGEERSAAVKALAHAGVAIEVC